MDQREFLDIILPIKDSLYRLAKSYLISNDEAQDAVQEAFLKLWKNKEFINLILLKICGGVYLL